MNAVLQSMFLAALLLLTSVLLIPRSSIHMTAAAPLDAPAQQTEPSPCGGSLLPSASPEVVQAGGMVEVSLRASVDCPGLLIPLHVVLVLDGSGSMTNSLQALRSAAMSVVDVLELDRLDHTRVGVVEFNDRAEILCDLSDDSAKVEACIDAVDADGESAIDTGIVSGLEVLARGRPAEPRSATIDEVMIILSDGANNEGCQPVRVATHAAKSQGVLVVTMCVGDECDKACLREVASSARYFFEADEIAGLEQVIQRIMSEEISVIPRQLVVSDVIPDNARYVLQSAQPAPDPAALAEGRLEWALPFTPREGITFSWRITPLEIGTHPVSLGATGVFSDNLGRGGSMTAPPISVEVVVELPTATPAPITPTAEPTMTPTIVPTPTLELETVFLPWAERP